MPFLLQENQNRDEAELGFGTVTLFAVVGDTDRRRPVSLVEVEDGQQGSSGYSLSSFFCLPLLFVCFLL